MVGTESVNRTERFVDILCIPRMIDSMKVRQYLLGSLDLINSVKWIYGEPRFFIKVLWPRLIRSTVGVQHKKAM